MKLILSGSLAIFLYLLAGFFIFRELKNNYPHRASIYCAWLAVLSHGFYNLCRFTTPAGISFSFFNTTSLILFIVVFILLIANFSKPVIKLGIVLFPLIGLIQIPGLLIHEQPQVLVTRSWQMNTHILTSIIAFSLLNIAALQAILLALQDHQLRTHQPLRIIRSLPPLQTMESLLFQMISTGVLFLSISLLSGFLFIKDLFAQHLVHKTVLSIFAWVTFSGLLAGRLRYGWRGRTAIRWTLTGFVALLLAYFGSKLVLEIILER